MQTKVKAKVVKKVKTPVKAAKNMGIGKLGASDVLYARKFRWTLVSKHCPNLEYFCKTCKVDFRNKKLYFEVMTVFLEGKDTPIPKWLDAIDGLKELLTLTVYDGCGTELEQYTFSIKCLNAVEKRCMEFDYVSNEVAYTEVELSFTKWERRFCVK